MLQQIPVKNHGIVALLPASAPTCPCPLGPKLFHLIPQRGTVWYDVDHGQLALC